MTRWPGPVLEKIHAVLPEAVELSEKGKLLTTIPEQVRIEPGRVLCLWGDAGWGAEVARGKYEAGKFSDSLVEASARMLRETWRPDPGPEWVTAVPSLHRPGLVRHFAERLASKLGLAFAPVLSKTRDTRPQKEMHNNVQQIRNLLGAFAVTAPIPRGPVLLVDDVVDSGWTLALLAVSLRQQGSGSVYPLALAKASPRGS